MRQGGATGGGLAKPLRLWSQRFTFLALMMVAVALIALSKANSPLASRMRSHVVDAFAPILSGVSRPVDVVANWLGALASASSLSEENARMLAEIERIRAVQIRVAQLRAENSALRQLLGASPATAGKHIVARVIADPGRGYVRSLLIGTGASAGIRRGLAVVNARGMIGRVTEVGERSARVLLLVDINSRIPVRIERTRERAILAGNNSKTPRLLYLSELSQVRAGDRVITSGHDGVLPPGLPVGLVSGVEGGIISVRPLVKWGRIEFVRILSYDPKGLVRPAKGVRKRLP
ncbi:MAG: rod shape-determining protein MreC [Alphaproteobacteria bacterium]